MIGAFYKVIPVKTQDRHIHDQICRHAQERERGARYQKGKIEQGAFYLQKINAEYIEGGRDENYTHA